VTERPPRIALVGFALESNGHAPVCTRAEFEAQALFFGAELTEDLARPAPRSSLTMTGFVEAMDASGPWEPVPIALAVAGASGPCDQAFFDEYLAEVLRRFAAAGPLDGVYVSQHGGAIATVDFDCDGTFFRRIREAVGPDVPIAGTLDLHGNISAAMVEAADVLISYLTNPHVDQRERGAEAAAAMRGMVAGLRPKAYRVKLPLIPPSVTQLTSRGPYADLIAYGQSKLDDEIMNVSILSGFSLGDTPENGMSVIVTARRDAARAEAVAKDIARVAWADRHRYVPELTSLDEATAMALACGTDPSRPSLLFADVADNPGGGGRGNTVWILEAFQRAGVEGCLVGIMNDPPLAAEAHALGEGARFRARFNREETSELSGTFEADAEVVKLASGPVVGRRGVGQGRSIDFGPSALLRVGGILVAVSTLRYQLMDPAYVERYGIDLAALRSLVVKSRGHFRAGFDETWPDERVVEVDVPGLTTPVLSRVPYRNVPRPIFPLDPDMEWSVPD